MIDKETIDKMISNDIDFKISQDGLIIIDSWDNVKEIEDIFNKPIDGIIENWGFSDEYYICDNCNNSIHIYSYDKKDYAFLESDNIIVCGNCIRDMSNDFYKEYIEYLINNPKHANTILPENTLENMGFKKCNCNNEECSFESGLREGSNDNPIEILKHAIAKNPDKDYIFDVNDVDMFGVRYTILSRDKLNNESD